MINQIESNCALAPANDNTELSWAAKGVYKFITTLPKETNLTVELLLRNSGDSKAVLQQAFRELEIMGYLVYTPIYDHRGRFLRRDWDVIIPT